MLSQEQLEYGHNQQQQSEKLLFFEDKHSIQPLIGFIFSKAGTTVSGFPGANIDAKEAKIIPV